MKNIIFTLFLFGVKCFGHAQEAATNTGNLKIHPGASISFFGDLTNASSASLLNNSNLYVKRNLLNEQALMDAGDGTLHFNGSITQTISGSGAFKTKNLVTNNASGIVLQNNLSVSGSHTFSSGIITTSVSPNYLVYENGSSYSGADDSRHINGWVQKAGTTDFSFPVGDGSVKRSISIANISEPSVFAVRYQAPTPYTSQMQAPLVSINPNEYWQVSKISGGSAIVDLNWDHSKVPFMNWALSEIKVASYDGSNWSSKGGTASGNTATTGRISSTPVTSFNMFSFASLSSALPLTLISFDAKRVYSITNISWKTTNEQNVDHFNVERSDNGRQFYTIGQQEARNSGQLEVYTAIDKKGIHNLAYYRLRSVDIDGSEQFSSVVKVTTASQTSEISLLNNPVKEKLVLMPGNNFSGEFAYSIVTSNGQVAQRGNIILDKRLYSMLPLKSFIKPGSYILSLYNNSQRAQIKFIVQ
jgi:hypothetical protein